MKRGSHICTPAPQGKMTCGRVLHTEIVFYKIVLYTSMNYSLNLKFLYVLAEDPSYVSMSYFSSYIIIFFLYGMLIIIMVGVIRRYSTDD